MSEAALSRSIVKALGGLEGCRAVKHHGSRFGTAGHPDIYGCVGGQAFFLEVKTDRGGWPTALQYRQLELWAAAGAVTGVCRSVREAVAVVLRGAGGERAAPGEWRDQCALHHPKGRVVAGQDVVHAAAGATGAAVDARGGSK